LKFYLKVIIQIFYAKNNFFDEFGDRFTKRLNILNINDNSLIKNIKETNLENSYKINYRIENYLKINKIIHIALIVFLLY